MNESDRKQRAGSHTPGKQDSRGGADDTPQIVSGSGASEPEQTRDATQDHTLETAPGATQPQPGVTVRETHPRKSSYGRLLHLMSIVGGTIGVVAILLVAAVLPMIILLLSPLPAVLVLVWLLGTGTVFAAAAFLVLRVKPIAASLIEKQQPQAAGGSKGSESVEVPSLAKSTVCCEQCEDPLQEGDKFCRGCGTQVARDTPTDTVEAAPTQPEIKREPDAPSSPSSGTIASFKEFGREYDAAAKRKDWEATYSMLDESIQQEFTEEAWAEKQQALRDANSSPAPLESVTVAQEAEAKDVPVAVTFHYEDETEETIMVGTTGGENSEPRRYMTAEEISELEQLSTPADSTSPDTDSLEAEARTAAQDYYQEAGLQNWSYTYEHLDSRTRGTFSEEVWFRKNQWFWNRNPTVYHVLSTESDGDSEGSVAGVEIRITGEDGSSWIHTTYFIKEDGKWLHRFSEEETDLFMPDSTFEEFVEAQTDASS